MTWLSTPISITPIQLLLTGIVSAFQQGVFLPTRQQLVDALGAPRAGFAGA